MDTIQINKSDFLKVYQSADSKVKTKLASLVDKEVLAGDIMGRVKTFEDACKVLKIKLPVFAKTESKDEIAYRKLKIIIEALNEGWKPNWNDTDERKWYPWFTMEGKFVLINGDYDCSTSHAGSRLCFRTEEVAKYAAKQFLSIYKDFFTL